MDSYIAKPIQAAELFALIEELTGTDVGEQQATVGESPDGATA